MRPKVRIIAAVGKDGLIGASNGLVFRCKDDMARFKRLTSVEGSCCLMGANTALSLPFADHVLPGRDCFVITSRRSGDFPAAKVVISSVDEAVYHIFYEPNSMLFGNYRWINVIGGASVYRQMIVWADELWLTETDEFLYRVGMEDTVYFPEIPKCFTTGSVEFRCSPCYDFDRNTLRSGYEFVTYYNRGRYTL